MIAWRITVLTRSIACFKGAQGRSARAQQQLAHIPSSGHPFPLRTMLAAAAAAQPSVATPLARCPAARLQRRPFTPASSPQQRSAARSATCRAAAQQGQADVVVVGAGVAGLHAAAKLHEAGERFAVLLLPLPAGCCWDCQLDTEPRLLWIEA